LLNFKIANLARDNELIVQTRKLAEKILEKDPKLELPVNRLLNAELQKLRREKHQWARIS